LRHRDNIEAPCERYMDFGISNPDFQDKMFTYAAVKYNPERTDPFNAINICPEIYKTNPDFSRQSYADIYLPLGDNFNCCEACLEEFPHRLWYSQQSFQEELTDNYGLFLPNDYRDIEGNFGQITNIFTIRDRLMIHAGEMLWEQPKNLQQQVTDDFTTFIGTGEFLGIPPRRVLDVDHGAGGSNDKWATIKTPVGVFFVDSIDRKVFKLGESLEPVSDNGLANWFYDALQVYYPFEDSRVRIRSTYDPRHRRVIITKVDYEPLFEWTVWEGEGEPLNVYWVAEDNTFAFFSPDEALDTISFGNPNFFRNRSWTISYSLLSNTWVSWHSYMPSFYYYDKETFYSFNGGFWSHDSKDKFHEFYGDDYPYVLDLISIDSPVVPQVWDAVIYQSIGRRWLGGGWVDDKYATFDKVLLYNNNQCTGLLDVSVKELGNKANFLLDAVRNDSQQISVTRKERLFFMNFFRDFVVDYNERFLSDLWDYIRDEYFIDKGVNPDAFDFGRNWQDRQPFRGDWIGARFYHNNTSVQLKNKYFIFNKIESLR